MARFLGWFRWATSSWATRSLAVGGLATVVDICVLLTAVKVFRLATPFAAMCGVVVGSVLTFFLNRHFAFRDHHPQLAPQALKFAGSTAFAMLVHAALVGLLADRLGVPVVLAKLVADLLVFSVGQLLLFRYVVFPKAAAARPPQGEASGQSQAERYAPWASASATRRA